MTVSQALHRYKYQLLSLLALLLVLYGEVIFFMAKQWYSDENYSHGFLVPLIAGYFLYERRRALALCSASPWIPGLGVVLLGLLQLVLGHAASEYFTQRSSLIVVLAGLVLFLFGRQAFRLASMPIAYLIMMVPLPYIVYNAVAFPLKLFITNVSVSFLQALGVVVLHEGNILLFPSITLEVADACSGIRSLVSLLALALAGAFFIRSTPLKRFVLVLSAVPVALVTNAARVIVTGILAQKWGARAAEGFFHEFAGMLVFLVAMALLAGIGLLLSDPDGEEASDDLQEVQALTGRGNSRISGAVFASVAMLLMLAGVFVMFRPDLQVPTKKSFSGFPPVHNGWHMVSQQIFTADVMDVLRPTDYISRTYTIQDGLPVQLYIGYHGGGRGGGEIHSPNHCLPGGGWQKMSSSNTVIETSVGRVNIVRAEYRRGEQAELFYYWFQVGDRTLTNEYMLKLAELTNSVLHRRRDASFVRISVPSVQGTAQSAEVTERFVKDFYPVIREFLPD